MAVLASAPPGLPSAHRNLIDYIADVGLVVSEAPRAGADPDRFLAPTA